MTLARIRIGTRKSPLAMVQAEEVRARLLAAWSGLEAEIVGMTTTGDNITARPLADMGGKGLFTKELEDALLEGSIDVAVHSMKDVLAILPAGLTIGCMLEREDPRDVLIGDNIASLADIPKGAMLGTSSPRRAAQMLMRRPDLKIVPMRGNVETRLAKVKNGEARATLLAKAGLNRLGLKQVPGYVLPIAEFIPAVAQGAIGIECREGDANVLAMLKPLSHEQTESAVICERAFLAMLDGSCRTPIAGYAEIAGNTLHFRGLIAQPDGSFHHAIEKRGKVGDAAAIGKEAGKELLTKAGKDFLIRV